MAHGGYADSIVGGMLGWLKGFASWVLKLFDLAGSGGVSPLRWLSDNWLSMLIFLVVAGIAADWLVWLVRWRPHWVWFRKKRVIVDDEDFFIGEDVVDSGMYDAKIFGRDAIRQSLLADTDAPRAKKSDTGPVQPRVRRPDAPTRREPAARPVAGNRAAAPARPAPRPRPVPVGTAAHAAAPSKRRPTHRRPVEEPAQPPAPSADIFEDDLFRIAPNDGDARSQWEDDVFNVSNLPGADKPRRRMGMVKKREEDGHGDDPFHIG